MNVSPLKPSAEGTPLEQLAGSKTLNEKQKLQEATRQFEAVLLRQILSSAQKPMWVSKFTPTSVASSIQQDMMVNELADKISSARVIGLAQTMETQLSREAGLRKETSSAPQPTKATVR